MSNIIQTVMQYILSVQDQTTEVTTISSTLLTDRTLSLREHEDVAAVLLSGKCRFVLEKYNVTMKEVYCVCYARCPWRPRTEFEKAMVKEMTRKNIREVFLLQLSWGITYPLIFVLGLTGSF